MIIVLDTNLWLELALNSGLGSALRFFLKRQKARLALPEVVRLEVQHNLRALLQTSIPAK
jgi:predicted nucleic acid-binding protein